MTSITSPTKLILIYGFADKPYLPRLKDAIGSVACSLYGESITTRREIIHLAKRARVNKMLCSRQDILVMLLAASGVKKASLADYAGSLFTIIDPEYGDVEIVFINPLEQLISVSYGKFLFRRYLSKFTEPNKWLVAPEFNWEVCEETNYERIISDYQDADLIAVDIETGKDPYVHITEVGYTAVWFKPDGKGSPLTTHSCVVELDSMARLAIVRKLNLLPAAKIFQNGKYDLAYLARYNAVPVNYMWDTATLMHCWYSELPKDLGFLGAFFSRNAMYWKDLAKSGSRRDQLLYNCKDTYTTALAFLQMMLEIPEYAKQNYLMEFPLLFPCHQAEMLGIKRDMDELRIASAEQKSLIATHQHSLNTMLGTEFNVNSPIQMKQLLVILGCKDLESADAKNIAKAAGRHPLNAVILDKVSRIRKARKLLSTYLTEGKEFNGRILYSLNPHGTDTGRLASKEHHFWCGLQMQNITRGPSVKRTLIADDDFLLYEADYSAAESRGTGYLAGCEPIIRNVEGPHDFHSLNASAFFGTSYELIYDDTKKKTLDKDLRDLSKRTNHGANYLMGPDVMVDTMGLPAIYKAQRLLKLPKLWMPRQVAEYLLERFHSTYPELRRLFYPGVVSEVIKTHKLVGPTGWTRFCFGHPDKNKRDLNAYVAHMPQSLNAMILNKAFMNVFYLFFDNPNIKILCQIHDSILFMVRKGHEYLVAELENAMVFPVQVKGADGKTRTMTVPAEVSTGGHRWSDIK